jgi:signal transduction histidine kinase
MTFQEQQDFAKQVADLNKYGHALNQCESVDEVVSLTLEAISLLFEFRHVTFVEARQGEVRVAGSTNPHLTEGSEPEEVARTAYETGETVTRSGEDARVTEESDVTAALAVPGSIVDEVTAIIVVRSAEVEEFGDEYIEPMEILSAHAATAISNIRSRERLERARQDLETRKEMVEMYDRLLRHDIGNDLQIMAGYADAIEQHADSDDALADYAEKVGRAAHNASDLIDRVGDLVSTLEEQEEPEPRDLQAILEETVADVESQHQSLTIEFDAADFAYQVYAGELLDSVFTNVLSNASVHNEGEITVWMDVEEPTPETVVVSMSDDGDGIPLEVSEEELFEMGFKGPDSDGTGFGLGFVRALTESYGGTVEARNGDHGGAEFRVTLKRA